MKSVKDGYNLPKAYFEADVRKATSRGNIITVLALEQLTGTRFENFYVETDKIRGADTISSLEILLGNPLTPYTKRLFSGFPGSGKTTELIKLCLHMQKKFNVIIFSATRKLKPNEITFESLLFEIMEDVMGYLYDNRLVDETDQLLKETVYNITEWCSETKIIIGKKEENTKTLALGINFLKGIFFKAKTEMHFWDGERRESTRMEERKINDLIFECNKIFDYLKDKTGKETLIVIDDLEKIPFLTARKFYINNSAFFRDFHCKMVLTIPVELIHHPDFALIENVFGEAEVLPMIKIKDKKGNAYNPGIKCLTKILERRLDLSLFDNECYKEAVKYSGGAIRDLFHIVQRAAMIEESNKIKKASMQKSVNYHKNTFAARIQERDDEIKIRFREYLDVLFDIHGGNKESPEKNLALLDLLRTRAVMNYDGDGFYDTHPLLDNFIKAYKEKMQKNGKQ